MSKNIPPIGSIIFMENDINPASVYEGTSWELVTNNIYFVTEGQQKYDIHGVPELPYTRPKSWIRRG